MRIDKDTLWVYDLEVFPNLFVCSCKSTYNNEVKTFEISERKNDLRDLLGFFLSPFKIFVGYNNTFYDDIIINWIITERNDLGYYAETNFKIYHLSKQIIDGEDIKSFRMFKSIDLMTMLFPKKLRVGLKELQITMRYPNVEDYTGSFDDQVVDFDKVVEYNLNDVDSTMELLNRSVDKLKLRVQISNKYDINVLSKDNMTTGLKILRKLYLDKTGLSWEEIKDRRDWVEDISLKDIIDKNIRYTNENLQALLSKLKTLVVHGSDKVIDEVIDIYGVNITMGMAGGHSLSTNLHKQDLLKYDCTSMFPTIVVNKGLYPPQLGEDFLKIYSDIYAERIKAKSDGDEVKSSTYKLILNSLIGKMKNLDNFCYSPKTALTVTINAQLYLFELIERLRLIGCEVYNVNTDGVIFSNTDGYKEVIEKWERDTGLKMTGVHCSNLWQLNVNDYLLRTDNGVEKHGWFTDEPKIGRGMNALVVPKAVNGFLLDGVPIRKTIREDNNWYDFLMYQKINRRYNVEYCGNKIGRVNRYYVSQSGCDLIKYEEDEYGHKIKRSVSSGGIPVRLMNEYDEPVDLDYIWYIKKAEEVIDKVKQRQLSLW